MVIVLAIFCSGFACGGPRCGEGGLLFGKLSTWAEGDHLRDQIYGTTGIPCAWPCTQRGIAGGEVPQVGISALLAETQHVGIAALQVQIQYPHTEIRTMCYVPKYLAWRSVDGLKNLVNRYQTLIDSLDNAEFLLLAEQIHNLRRVMRAGHRQLNWNALGNLRPTSIIYNFST